MAGQLSPRICEAHTCTTDIYAYCTLELTGVAWIIERDCARQGKRTYAFFLDVPKAYNTS